jgi:diaminopimelate decarboxylase
MSPLVQGLLSGHADLLDDLSHAFGGPVHLLFPAQFESNVAAFRTALSRRGVDGRIYFAKKANKAACWVERCAALGIGVDVSSPGELREALAHGVCGPDITVTGPAKSEELLRLALLHRCLTAVDDLGELETFAELAYLYGCGRILLRCLPSCQPSSRFGLDEEELALALHACREVDDHVALEGFSFHLSGYEVQPRADVAAQLLRHCRKARALGLHPSVVSIGGGFAVNYVGPDAWDTWEQSRRDEEATLFHGSRTFESFGGFYPYHSPTAGATMLGAVLGATPAGERESLATLLRRDGVTLSVEPGRSLLDQAGLTVFRIQGVRIREYGILTVDGTSLSLSEQWFNSEFLPDPVLLAVEPGSGRAGSPNGVGSRNGLGEEPFAACVGGASCLEVDMLSWRKIAFGRRPQVGDLLVYVNTAGYQMDSNESAFHDLALPPKVVIEHDEQKGGRARWRLDRHQR